MSEHALPPGTVGFVYLPALFAVDTGSVLTATLGARVAHAIDTGRLKHLRAAAVRPRRYMLYRGIKAA